MNALHMTGVSENRSERMMAGLAALAAGKGSLMPRSADRIRGLAGEILDAVALEHDRRFGSGPSFG